MLLLLTIAAGCVDAISYLAMGEVFTAAMTGNTVLLGIAVGQGEASAALRSLMALGGFMLGGIVGAAIVDSAPQVKWPRTVTIAFAVEVAVLSGIAASWHLAGDSLAPTGLNLLVVVTGLAMGLQSVAVNRLGVAGIATTYVTGTLTHLAARFVRWLRANARSKLAEREGPHNPWLPASVWLGYGAGAVLAGGLKLLWPHMRPMSVAGEPLRWQTVALGMSILLVLTVVVATLIRAHRNS